MQVISDRLGHDELFVVSTLHRFLWGEIKAFTKDIRDALRDSRIPQLIAKAEKDDNGKNSDKARKARARVAKLTEELAQLDGVQSFRYDDAAYSQYSEGRLSHDDVIEIGGYLLVERPMLQKAFGFRYPFVLVDEAQDTFPVIVSGFNLVGSGEGFPVVGYFGDPWQQIYDQRAGDFQPPEGGTTITKTENFRCSESVITFLKAFRKDVEQYPAGDNKGRLGSVLITLVEAEEPAAPRKRYSDEQLDRVVQRMDQALENWGWAGRTDVIRLFLARQMIARRLGFAELNSLFTGQYASVTAKDNYESGEHFLLKSVTNAIWPLIHAHRKGDQRSVIDLLRTIGRAFDTQGKNRDRSLKEMIDLSKKVMSDLDERWKNGTLRDVYGYCLDNDLVQFPERLKEHVTREPRAEEYDEDVYGSEKGDWLADRCLAMATAELEAYCDFIQENTPYSTQHGVKGEEYSDVLVVFDDVEAAWNNYSFKKLLTPNTSGDPTEGQMLRSQRVAYVCFSRAEEDLRILLYTENPVAAKSELIDRGFFDESQIEVLML